MSNFVLKTLIDKRIRIFAEQTEMNKKYKQQVEELNAAINELKGNGAVYPNGEHFDDEHPDYIKASQEEM